MQSCVLGEYEGSQELSWQISEANTGFYSLFYVKRKNALSISVRGVPSLQG